MLNEQMCEYTLLQAYFLIILYWFGFLPLFPPITMRLFSEEFKMGTIETLMTAPARDWQVVLAKFGAALIFHLALIPPRGTGGQQSAPRFAPLSP